MGQFDIEVSLLVQGLSLLSFLGDLLEYTLPKSVEMLLSAAVCACNHIKK